MCHCLYKSGGLTASAIVCLERREIPLLSREPPPYSSAWSDQPSVSLSFTAFTSAWSFLPPGTHERVFAPPPAQHAPLVNSHSLGQMTAVAAGGISTNVTGCQSRRRRRRSCCYFFIREGRAAKVHGSRFRYQSFCTDLSRQPPPQSLVLCPRFNSVVLFFRKPLL